MSKEETKVENGGQWGIYRIGKIGPAQRHSPGVFELAIGKLAH